MIILESKREGSDTWKTRNRFPALNATATKEKVVAEAERQAAMWGNVEPNTQFRIIEK